MLRAGRRYPLDAPVLRSCSHPQTRAETNQSGRQTLGGRRKQDKSGTAGGATQSTCPARHDFDDVQRPVHRAIQDQPDARSGLHIENLPLALLEGELDELIHRAPLLAVQRRLLRSLDVVLGHLAGACGQTPPVRPSRS